MPKMKRILNGKTQYRATYRWIDADGTTKQSNTKWFDNKLEAQKAASILKNEKAKPKPMDKKVFIVFDEFVQTLEAEVNDDRLKNKSTEITFYQRATTLKEKYYPKELMNTDIKDIDSGYFRKWLEYLNKQKMGGQTIRGYKAVLQKFNKYLANHGYYTNYNADIEIAIGIGRVDIKPKKTGVRKDRRIPSVADIEEIRRYYENDLGKFRNFYYYTFFYFEFYTGCRVSETVALQWRNVDLSPETRVIYIRNAINHKEKKKIALKRTAVGNFSTKNETSERGVVIFDMIYQLLKDYKYRYRIHFKLTEEEQEDCFVFPSMRNPHIYANSNHLLEELKRACEGAGIEPLDNGMMRHGTATFLVAPPPDGLGYSPEQVYSQLGHCDSQMINTIYTAMQKQQLTKKNKAVFNRIYHPEEDEKEIENVKELEAIFHRVKGNNRAAEEVGKMLRFAMELERVNASSNKVYYYLPEDEKFINLMNFKEKYPDIKFVAKE